MVSLVAISTPIHLIAKKLTPKLQIKKESFINNSTIGMMLLIFLRKKMLSLTSQKQVHQELTRYR
jgi:hypothetical protein